jgi:predicted XRE-type DNA-binding protein
MESKPRALVFAAELALLIKNRGMKQRQIASELHIPSSVVNRLCKSGVGSEDNICLILERLGLKKRRIDEQLADRRAELSRGKAHEAWKGFRYAFRDENEYLAETCPFPFERAFACTHLGIPINEVVDLAKSHGIKNIQDLREVNPWEFIKFAEAFCNRFGDKAKEIVLAEKCEIYPPVFLFDFAAQKDAADYVNLTNCKGKLLFGLPHLVIGDYEFSKSGEIGSHRNTGGVELLYSLEGTFELTCQGLVCQTMLTSGSMLVFDARKRHSIRLIVGEKGRLLMARYDPRRKEVRPGRPPRRRQKR